MRCGAAGVVLGLSAEPRPIIPMAAPNCPFETAGLFRCSAVAAPVLPLYERVCSCPRRHQPRVLPVGHAPVQTGIHPPPDPGRHLGPAVRGHVVPPHARTHFCAARGHRRKERCESTSAKLLSAWAAERTAHGPLAKLSRAFRNAWWTWYLTPVAWACLWIFFGCLSSAVLMRSILVWFETQDHSAAHMFGIVVALMVSEVCKVR